MDLVITGKMFVAWNLLKKPFHTYMQIFSSRWVVHMAGIVYFSFIETWIMWIPDGHRVIWFDYIARFSPTYIEAKYMYQINTSMIAIASNNVYFGCFTEYVWNNTATKRKTLITAVLIWYFLKCICICEWSHNLPRYKQNYTVKKSLSWKKNETFSIQNTNCFW